MRAFFAPSRNPQKESAVTVRATLTALDDVGAEEKRGFWKVVEKKRLSKTGQASVEYTLTVETAHAAVQGFSQTWLAS